MSQGRLLGAAAGLGFDLGTELRADVLLQEAIETAAIEGETLDPTAVRSSVARRLGLPDAGLQTEDRRVEGLLDVLLDATVECEAPLTAKRLQGWQAALFPTGYSGINQITVGAWRPGPEPMRVVSMTRGRETIHFEAPPADQVADEMNRFLQWWPDRQALDGVLRAAMAHLWFVTIHPFEDGNGRIARALTDMALAQDEGLPARFYSMSVQIRSERELSYYEILERTQRGDLDITPWFTWFIGCMDRAIERSGESLARVIAKARFWQLHAQSELNSRQTKVVKKLLDAGPGGFEGGLTTRKYVSIARTSRATAGREIADLVGKGILRRNPGGGRSASYDLVWETPPIS